jgi:hypothetical protein
MADQLQSLGLTQEQVTRSVRMVASGAVPSLRDALVEIGITKDRADDLAMGINIGLGFVPGNDIKDAIEFLTGRDLVAGDSGLGVRFFGGVGLVAGSGGQLRAVKDAVLKKGGRAASEFIEKNLRSVLQLLENSKDLPAKVARKLGLRCGNTIHQIMKEKYDAILKQGGRLFDDAWVLCAEKTIKLPGGEIGRIDALVFSKGKLIIEDWAAVADPRHIKKGWKKYVPNIMGWLREQSPEFLRSHGIDPAKLNELTVTYVEGHYLGAARAGLN